MIKELKDVLVFVEQMPREWQLRCVRMLAAYVDSWEQRQQEPELSDREWRDLQWTRRSLQIDVQLKRLQEIRRQLRNLEK